jgi:carbonic anhydrase
MKTQLKKISLILLSSFTLVSCTTTESYDDTNETKGFPDDIVSYEFPLGTTNLLGQTPIDVNTFTTKKISTTDPVIHYSSILLSSVENTTENLKINLSAAESIENYITIKGHKYELQQFHFHRHSEHKINGEYSKMEIHFVHKSSTGAYAVLGILVKNGAVSPSLQVLFNASPSHKGINSVPNHLNLTTLLPKDISSYYTYSGSLTTPNLDLTPNQGPLTWVLFKNTISLSRNQLKEYSLKYKEENFRVIQPLNNRTVYENKKNNY